MELAELRAERAAIDEVLAVLERLARTQGKRRGRPPAWLASAMSPNSEDSPAPSRKRVMSPEAKRRKVPKAP
jgi:hypothetical protein